MHPQFALTETVSRALHSARDRTTIADLLFLERWEIEALPGVAAALRVTQIRRANPKLAADLKAELANR